VSNVKTQSNYTAADPKEVKRQRDRERYAKK
jgi:hypothetical protein